IWSTSTRGVMDFPFPAFARFFESHGLLSVSDQPQWQTVTGGSDTYVAKVLAQFKGELRLDTRVKCLKREGNGVVLSTARGEERYDAVVCATHSDQALAMLPDACEAECSLLANVPFASNIAYLHTDESLMPKRRRAWSSWNAILARDELSDEPIGVSYWMNLLQKLDTPTQYFVSLNPPRAPRPETVLYQTRYEHPLYTPATIQAQRRLPQIQGRNRVWWAGAWTAYGFHEDGFKSGLRAVAGIDRECLPLWANSLGLEAEQSAISTDSRSLMAGSGIIEAA
ncbi:MAG: FAD-dependent oxidoreductase, partial [Nevskia sp.]|nr:FAD-dependent oxidoreductase [Nevskia sp.]